MNLRYRPFDEFSQQIGTASDEEVAAYLEDGFKAGNYTQVRVGVGELWRRLRERPAAPATAPDDRREALDASIGRIALLRGEGRIGALKEAARLHAGRGGAFIEDALELLAIAAAFGVCRDAAIRAIKTGWNDGLVEARPAAESAPAATPDPAPAGDVPDRFVAERFTDADNDVFYVKAGSRITGIIMESFGDSHVIPLRTEDIPRLIAQLQAAADWHRQYVAMKGGCVMARHTPGPDDVPTSPYGDVIEKTDSYTIIKNEYGEEIGSKAFTNSYGDKVVFAVCSGTDDLSIFANAKDGEEYVLDVDIKAAHEIAAFFHAAHACHLRWKSTIKAKGGGE